jgi:hypothetical protein
VKYTLPDGKLSPSRVSMYNRCPACFEWIYVLHQPARMHIALPRGIAVHAGVHAAREMVMDGREMDVDLCWSIAINTYEYEVAKIDPCQLDLGSTSYKTSRDAAGHIVELVKRAIPEIVLARDARVGIYQAEARVDFTDIFPFDFECYLDVLLKDGTFADLKTANRAGPPDVWSYTQLRLYALPWFKAGQPTQLVIDQVALPTVKNPIPAVNFYEASATADHFAAVEKLVMDTAAAISTGIFPARPGWWCKTEHGLAA